MAPRPVFIGIEAEFLLDRLDQFRASQDASSVSNFMTRICAEYLATWPVDNQDEEKRLRKQIHGWYYNKVREKVTVADKKEGQILHLTKAPKRPMQPYQAYYRLFREELKPLVNKAYKHHLGSLPDGVEPPSWLKFSTDFVKERYRSIKDPNIKARVEKHRLRMDEDEDNGQGRDKRRKGLEKAVKCLPHTCQLVAEAIHRDTGWHTSILVGGRDPVAGGTRNYIFHLGETPDGKSWDGFSNWRSVQESWEKFVERSFPSNSMPRKKAQSAVPELQNTASKPGSNIAAAPTTSTSKSKVPTDAALVRGRSVRNSNPRPLAAPPQRKRKSTSKERLTRNRVNLQPQEVIANESSSDSEQEEENRETKGENHGRKGKARATEVGGSCHDRLRDIYEDEDETEDEEETEDEGENGWMKLLRRDSEGFWGSGEDGSTNGRHSPDGEEFTLQNKENKTERAKRVPKAVPRRGSEDDIGGAPSRKILVTTEGNTEPGRDTRCDQIIGGNTTECNLPVVRRSRVHVAREGELDSHHPTTTASLPTRPQSHIPANIPEFFRDAAEYLFGITQCPQWIRLVAVWLRLEEKLGYCSGKEGRLPIGSRPEDIGLFMKNHRNYKKAPSLTGRKLKLFTEEWKRWWAELQPKWRDTKVWPFEREPNTSGSWDTLLQGGPNGVYLVILSAAWWVSGISKDSEDGELWDEVLEVLDEVYWVFSQLLSSVAPTASPNYSQPKRKHNQIPEPAPKRRKRI